MNSQKIEKRFCRIKTIPIFAIPTKKVLIKITTAEVAHLVEHDLAKVGVAGSSPVFRSEIKSSKLLQSGLEFLFTDICGCFFTFTDKDTLVAELVDALDLKSNLPKGEYGFDSRLGYESRCNYLKDNRLATVFFMRHF